jgi:uncharacterized membrane protein YphA (DoxX/SURF4 family)
VPARGIENILDQATALTLVETVLRIALGLRILHSGISNVRRWPNPVRNAAIVFPFCATAFGFVAVFFMVAGGLGLALGFGTQLAALMIALFLIPTLKIQRHWLRKLPSIIEELDLAVGQEGQKSNFRLLAKQAFHSHETGWQNNLLLLLLALFFVLRGSPAFGIDNLLG